MKITDLIKREREYVISLRREFHKHPEVSWNEFRTSRRVKEELAQMGISFQGVAGTGVLATIEGRNPGKTLILRADMDALSVQETVESPYKSEVDGVMHACGHDGHTAMLLGAAKILNEIKDTFCGTIKLLFQPAEEVCEGVLKLLEEDCLGSADGCFGIHIWVDLPCGKISVEEGPRMASGDYGTIHIEGKSCHGSAPHQGVDALLAAAATVMNLQSINSRELNQLESNVFTIGTFESGERFNVIAPSAKLKYTIRSFNRQTRDQIPLMIDRIIKGTADAYRATARMEHTRGAAAVINDSGHAGIAEQAVIKLFGEGCLSKFEKIAASEDFGILQERYPGVFAFVGGGNPEKNCNFAHHNGCFNIDEDCLEYGCGLTVQYALDFLA